MANVTEFTDGNFESEVLQASEPVLVDFWAVWCGPCRQLAPVIDELAEDNGEAVKIGKCDVDANQDTARKYGIQSIPTMLIFQNGEEVNRLQGAMAKSKIQQALDAVKANA